MAEALPPVAYHESPGSGWETKKEFVAVSSGVRVEGLGLRAVGLGDYGVGLGV